MLILLGKLVSERMVQRHYLLQVDDLDFAFYHGFFVQGKHAFFLRLEFIESVLGIKFNQDS